MNHTLKITLPKMYTKEDKQNNSNWDRWASPEYWRNSHPLGRAGEEQPRAPHASHYELEMYYRYQARAIALANGSALNRA